MCHERRNDHGRFSYSRSARRAHEHHSPPHSEINFYASNDPISSPEVSPVRQKRRKQEVYSFQGDLRKLKPPSFDGEREREDDAEAWLLGKQEIFSVA
jgi:hypothetical protein